MAGGRAEESMVRCKRKTTRAGGLLRYKRCFFARGFMRESRAAGTHSTAEHHQPPVYGRREDLYRSEKPETHCSRIISLQVLLNHPNKVFSNGPCLSGTPVSHATGREFTCFVRPQGLDEAAQMVMQHIRELLMNLLLILLPIQLIRGFCGVFGLKDRRKKWAETNQLGLHRFAG